MQTYSKRRYRKAKTKAGKIRQATNYDIAKLKSSGLFDATKRSRLKVRRISDMTEEERKEFGL